jgi:putative photosynthetic complex assembly protein
VSDQVFGENVPRLPLLGAAALLVLALGLVSMVRLTGVGATHAPPSRVVEERDLRFEDRDDGSIAVFDARQNLQIDRVAPGTNGFLRGTLRGLARERKREGVGAALPFQLSEHSDGHLLLTDPGTGRFIDLGSFGPTNAGAFARLMTATAAKA